MKSNLQSKYVIKELNKKDTRIAKTLCQEKQYTIELSSCSSCNYILKSPRLCSSCGDMICIDCYDKNPTICVSCGANFKDQKIQKCVLDMIANIKVLCPNKCNEIIKYGDLFLHLEQCKLTQRKATCLGCKIEMDTTNELNEIKEHVVRCNEYEDACVYCKKSVKKIEMIEHYITCDSNLVGCSECKKNILMRDFEPHVRNESCEKIVRIYEEKLKFIRIEYETKLLEKENYNMNLLYRIEVKLKEKEEYIRKLLEELKKRNIAIYFEEECIDLMRSKKRSLLTTRVYIVLN
jgi:hypothetical protein